MIYNLKYKKFNQNKKLLLEKEGEIIINQEDFQLKGKGAGDVGEKITFADIKDWKKQDEQVSFTTVSKDKYVLSNSGNLFTDFLRDFVKARNGFLLKALFMTDGEFVDEYEGDFEIFSRYEKSLSKGRGKIQLYDKSIVIVPEFRDAFSISLNFLKRTEIDDDFFEIKLILDQGFVIHFKKLGSIFEDFKDKMAEIQQRMYQQIVDKLKEILLQFDSTTLIKLVYEMKNGKAINTQKIKKMNPDLLEEVKLLVLHDDLSKKHFEYYAGLTTDDYLYLGISPDPPKHQPHGENLAYATWFFVGMPEKNLVVAEITNGGYRGAYFFKIIMEKGDPYEKVEEKLLEINQAMLKLKFVTTAFYKDKRELRRSVYRFALRKLPYLRLLRRSYVGRLTPFNEVDWDKRITDIFQKAQIQQDTEVKGE